MVLPCDAVTLLLEALPVPIVVDTCESLNRKGDRVGIVGEDIEDE